MLRVNAWARSFCTPLNFSRDYHRSLHFAANRVSSKTVDLGPYSGLADVRYADKVFVAMSGGVDSATVAALLARRYPTVEGVFMNNWSSQSRCQESSWRVVQQLCKLLHIPCRRLDLEHDYWTDVFEPMLSAYQRGETPNPDLGCNHYIKFGHLITQLKHLDPEFRWLATGHYAGLDSASRLVRRAQYMPKDQSYYLATVETEALQHALFPLAHLEKPQVRRLASQLGLPDAIARKRDSQGLCFVEQQQEVGQRGFRRFLAEYLDEKPGPVVLASDPKKVVGEHRGLWTHTVGQRASIPMPQTPKTRGQWFVVSKDIERNALLIARGTQNPRLMSSGIESRDFHWHSPFSGDVTNLYAQYRSLQEPWKVTSVRPGRDSSSKSTEPFTEFRFDSQRRAVAPGQYVVVYDNDVVIGAGTISRTFTA